MVTFTRKYHFLPPDPQYVPKKSNSLSLSFSPFIDQHDPPECQKVYFFCFGEIAKIPKTVETAAILEYFG